MVSIEQKPAKSSGTIRKGYGFFKFGEDEVFLHHSALDEFGIETVYAEMILSQMSPKMEVVR